MAASGAFALLCVAGASAQATAAVPDPASGAAVAVSWQADLSKVGSDDVNVRYAAGALKVRAKSFHTASDGAGAGYGSELLSAHGLDSPVNRVRAELDADVPAGTDVVVDVRGRTSDGTWTEWRAAPGGTAAVLPRPVTQVQARVTFDDPTGRAAVHGLRLSADNVAQPRSASQATAAFSSKVYATREGLVGGTTANGHVIKSNDHFVALPSRRGLSPNGSSQYSVEVCGPARCETAPVYDIGPWNIHDDYWNPSATREQFKDLAQGLPEAQAAYQSGYNGGKDGSGRTVGNPAGIDLADGTFWKDLKLADNSWVTVTYLWTGSNTQARVSSPTGMLHVRSGASTGAPLVGTAADGASVAVECRVSGERVAGPVRSSAAWYRIADGMYVSGGYLTLPDGGRRIRPC